MQVKQRKASFNVLLTTYEFMMGKHDVQRLSSLQYEYIIVDEAHRLKNSSCKLNREMQAYTSTSRLLLTGTPPVTASIDICSICCNESCL